MAATTAATAMPKRLLLAKVILRWTQASQPLQSAYKHISIRDVHPAMDILCQNSGGMSVCGLIYATTRLAARQIL
jgi:hypothetical protein